MVIVRKAQQADSDMIVDLQVSAFQALYDKYQDAGNPVLMTTQDILKRMAMQGSSYYLIEAEGVIIGFIRVVEQAEKLRISPIAILPTYQGRGYGRWAMLQVEKLYPQVQYFVLDTIAQEEKLCRFYESLGYLATGIGLQLQEGMDLIDYIKVVSDKK